VDELLPQCPACGSVRLFGPALIIITDKSGKAVEFPYYDCARCHFMFRLLEDGGYVGA
jgi:hypothetical protein